MAIFLRKYKGEDKLPLITIENDIMDKSLGRGSAFFLYYCGRGIGISGKDKDFDKYYKEGNTYKEFIDTLIKEGLWERR